MDGWVRAAGVALSGLVRMFYYGVDIPAPSTYEFYRRYLPLSALPLNLIIINFLIVFVSSNLFPYRIATMGWGEYLPTA